MAAAGMPTFNWCSNPPPPSLPAMSTFLWVLQCSGVVIALLGMGRDRRLRLRRLGR